MLSAMEWLLNHENDDDIDAPVQLVEDLHVSHREISEVILFIATDKRGIHIIFFLFLHETICCGYSLEAPR